MAEVFPWPGVHRVRGPAAGEITSQQWPGFPGNSCCERQAGQRAAAKSGATGKRFEWLPRFFSG